MRSYDVYQHPTRGYRAVKDGFSWPGFFFGWIWCLIKGLPGRALAVFGASIAFSLFVESEAGILLASLVIAGVIGWCGNDWRCKKLLGQGFTHVGLVQAPSSSAAVAEASSSHTFAPGEKVLSPATS